MTDKAKTEFAAWVEREMHPDGGVEWDDGPGLETAPRIAQDGKWHSLEAEWDAFQAGYAKVAALEALLLIARDGLDDYWVTLPEGEYVVSQIEALSRDEVTP